MTAPSHAPVLPAGIRRVALRTALAAVALTTVAPAAAHACTSSSPAPWNSDPGRTVVADNFESGLGKWSDTYTTGGASIYASSTTARDGECGLRWRVPETPYESMAYVAKWMPSGTSEIRADGWFRIEREGSDSSWNAPTFRFFSGGERILDVSRQNDSGSFFVRYPNGDGGWTIKSTGRYLSLGRWYRVQVHATARGNSSLVEVWLDGSKVFSTTSATFDTWSIQRVMLGSNHNHQVADVAADDVVIKVPW
jgi:hypothetical protein